MSIEQSIVSTRSGAVTKLHRGASWLAFALLVLFGGEFASVSIARLLGIQQYSDWTPQALVAVAAARYAALLLLALFGVYAILQAPLASIGLRRPKVGGLAWGVVIGLGTGLIFSWMAHKIGMQSSYELQYTFYVMSQATGLTAAASILIYIFFGPIVEEIVFRGVVLGGLVNVTNGVVAVVVSALIFAGIHAAGGAGQITASFIGGLLYGWLYLRTRSIVPTSVAHIIYNAVAFYPLILYALRAKHF